MDPIPTFARLLWTKDPGGSRKLRPCFPGPHPGTGYNFRLWLGYQSQEPSNYRPCLQTPQHYSIQLQGWASRAAGGRPTTLTTVDEGSLLAQKRPSHPQLEIPHCYSSGPGQNTKRWAPDSEASSPQLRLWLVLWPHADVYSCLSSTWTSCQNPRQACRLGRLGGGHCTDPCCKQDSGHGKLSQVWTSLQEHKMPLPPPDPSVHKGRGPNAITGLVAEAYIMN